MIEIELKLEVENFPKFEAEPLRESRVVDYCYYTADYKLLSSGIF